ncbi:headcase protein isoform X1 [Episyrphus balteatus]|uniref:headcase protein isoform X1 n=1 Tax=Episyrphus balteatus TaxID=286459 RepID=UPI0024863996|nr:headcase protein isoform X1 [Episyrphus balteatus]
MAPRRNNLSNHHTTSSSSSSSATLNTPPPQSSSSSSSSSSSASSTTTTTGSVVDVHNLLGLTVISGGGGGIAVSVDQDNHHLTIETSKIFASPVSSESSITSSSSSSSLMMSPTRETTYIRCCVPTGDCFKMSSSSPDYGLISMENLSDCIRVLCNNENCSVGQYMHRECFESWEQTVLITLKSIGRARSWSDRQRLQNLWTKKGYDLVYKACGCKCGRGHIRKDLDWQPPTPTKASHNGVYLNNNRNGGSDEESTKKKKKRNRNQKPSLSLTTINPGNYHPNTQNSSNNHHPQQQQQQHHQSSNGGGNVGVGVIGNGLMNNNSSNNTNNGGGSIDLRARTGSLSSSSGTTSPPVSASSESSVSPVHIHQNNMNSNNNCNNIVNTNNNLNNGNSNIVLNNNNIGNNGINGINNNTNNNNNIMITNGNLAPGSKLKQLTPMEQQQIVQQQKNKEVELYSERVRSTSGCNGIFSRRLDFSSFNLLPKTRLNSYQVKIEDEGNHGNDETRLFILSSLAQSQMSRVACILCEEPMLVFDRYPLVDGSFFLSPKQHSAGCIEVKYEGRSLFLTCVCMGCLDGTSSGRIISCRFCGELWDGSSLVLGTMYAYDIFAAMPCCAERLKCNTCLKLLLHPQQRLNFFSDYSHCVTCPYCATQDTHFVKPLGYCYTKSVSKFALNLA